MEDTLDTIMPAKDAHPELQDLPPKRTAMDAYLKSSFVTNAPQINFGSGTRPPLSEPTLGPGSFEVQ